MTYRKLILADRIRSGAHARPRYRLTIQENRFWGRDTRIFVTYCEEADRQPLLNESRHPAARPSWSEIHHRGPGVTTVSKVEDPLLEATLTAFLQDAKINGHVR